MGGLTNDVRRFWWAVLAIALLTIVTRLPSLLHLQAIDDEETYSVVANVIVDGGWPSDDWETVTLRTLIRLICGKFDTSCIS